MQAIFMYWYNTRPTSYEVRHTPFKIVWDVDGERGCAMAKHIAAVYN